MNVMRKCKAMTGEHTSGLKQVRESVRTSIKETGENPTDVLSGKSGRFARMMRKRTFLSGIESLLTLIRTWCRYCGFFALT